MPRFRTLMLLLAGVASLSASDFRPGLQVGLAFPGGDWKDTIDTSVGIQFNLTGLWTLSGGEVVRGKLGTTSSSEKVNGITNTISVTYLGAEYLHFFDGTPDHGVYAGGGLHLGQDKAEQSKGNESASKTINRPVFTAAVGYQFSRHWSAELNYLHSSVSLNGVSYSLPAFAVVAGYTF